MNERIRELMLEAGFVAPEISVRAQNLAKLIVEECVNILDAAVHHKEPPSTYVNKLKDNFNFN